MTLHNQAKIRLDEIYARLVDLSHRIHSNPEIGYEEEKAASWLSEELDGAGFQVETAIAGLPTAFRATIGSGPLHIGFCAEFDALPSIGHACGHNVIAATSLGAAIAAGQVADDAGITVTLLGTPAEEVLRSGGKIVLLEAGEFDDFHVAMMTHPAPWDVAIWPIVAASFFEVRYHGKASHASGFPQQGINAADAMTIAQTSIGLIRQHIRPSDRIHGIVTSGGEAFNVIPALATGEFAVRAQNLDQLDEVYQKVVKCFEAGALATGSRLEILGGSSPFAHLEHDEMIAAIYQANAEKLGRRFPSLSGPSPATPVSTDMGNVSLLVPSIHPALGIGSLPAVNHQPEFAAACITPNADQAIYDGALAMAWTAIDLATNGDTRSRLLAKT